MTDRIAKIGVVGAGAWGTALAATSVRAGADVRLWAYEPELVDEINEHHSNSLYLKDIPLDPAIVATANLADMADRDALLIVTPAQALGAIAAKLNGVIKAATPALICAKGIEQGTGRLLSDVLAEALPQAEAMILSGPSFAHDVARGAPTAVTLAGRDSATVERVARMIATPTFRPYLSDDLIGAQAGGSVKNVLAIACGIVEGKGFGESARAALTARGFSELQRFALKLGARPETVSGLSGLGDLILTCNSLKSRNMSLGAALGRGETMQSILDNRRSVSEGVHTAPVLVEMCDRMNLELPICSAVHRIVTGSLSVDDAISALLNRPLRSEH